MCGLFGMAGRGITQEDLDILEELGIANMVRGLDSTGLIQGNLQKKHLSYRVEKDDIPFNDFVFYHRDYKKGIMTRTTDNFFMMHVRAATRGEVSKQNAHPFEFEDFVAMHNGTLKDKQYQDKEKTDSELFFKALQERVLKESSRDFVDVLKDHLASLDKDSAYAITILSRKDQCIYFARNQKRSLSCAVSHKRDVFYWSSEIGAMDYILQRHGRYDKSKDDYRVFTFSEDSIFKLYPYEISKGKEDLFYITKVPKTPIISSVSDVPWVEPNKTSVPAVGNIWPKKRVLFRSKCVQCQRDMNLIDMYEGVCVHEQNEQFQCKECVELETSIDNILH